MYVAHAAEGEADTGGVEVLAATAEEEDPDDREASPAGTVAQAAREHAPPARPAAGHGHAERQPVHGLVEGQVHDRH